MSTAAQAISSRTNSQQSTGPITPEGKSKMYANPLRHGLTSKHLILPGESLEAFEALHTDMREHFGPATPTEEALVAKLAESEWRLTRARRVETDTLHLLMEQVIETDGVHPDRALTLVFLRHGKDIERLRRYETTIARAEAKQRKELDQLLKNRYRLEMLTRNDEEEIDDPEPTVGSVSQNPQSPCDEVGANERLSPSREAAPMKKPVCPLPTIAQ